MKAIEKSYHQSLGDRLRQTRIQCGFSQDDIGEALGVSFQQVQKYEKGLNRISPYRLIVWAKTTQTSVLDLLAINNIDHGHLEFTGRTKIDVEFVKAFKELPEIIRKQIIRLIRAINGGNVA